MRIFIVENHRDTLRSMQMYLEDMGHEVLSAETLKDAAVELPAAGADVLFCDIGLPDGVGWDLLPALKLPKPLFAVAMSGFGMHADSARSRQNGFRHHLLKPFSVSEISRLLAEAEAEKSKNAGT